MKKLIIATTIYRMSLSGTLYKLSYLILPLILRDITTSELHPRLVREDLAVSKPQSLVLFYSEAQCFALFNTALEVREKKLVWWVRKVKHTLKKVGPKCTKYFMGQMRERKFLLYQEVREV